MGLKRTFQTEGNFLVKCNKECRSFYTSRRITIKRLLTQDGEVVSASTTHATAAVCTNDETPRIGQDKTPGKIAKILRGGRYCTIQTKYEVADRLRKVKS